jgi:hypothetical protein
MKKKKMMMMMKGKRAHLYKTVINYHQHSQFLSYIDKPPQVLTASGHSQAVQ